MASLASSGTGLMACAGSTCARTVRSSWGSRRLAFLLFIYLLLARERRERRYRQRRCVRSPPLQTYLFTA